MSALPALRANTLYRISIAVFQLDKRTPYVTKKPPVIYFRTGP